MEPWISSPLAAALEFLMQLMDTESRCGPGGTLPTLDYLLEQVAMRR